MADDAQDIIGILRAGAEGGGEEGAENNPLLLEKC